MAIAESEGTISILSDHDQPQDKSSLLESGDPDAMDISQSDVNVADSPEEAGESAKSDESSPKNVSFYTKSWTSTYRYDQTPFEDFSKQVTQLCQSLWPPTAKEYRIQRLLGGPNSRFMGVLRSKKLGRFLWPTSPPKAFEIERMAGGTFNRIVGIRIIGSGSEDPIPLILRTSRAPEDSRPDREIATLQWLRRHTSIPVPHINAFDLTEDNPLKTPYVIQNRIPGIPFATAQMNGLSHKQWCKITKEIAHVILDLQSHRNPTPGLIESTTQDNGVQQFDICPFDVKNPRDTEWKERQAGSKEYEADKATALHFYARDTLHFLATQFGRWVREELRPVPSDILYSDHMCDLSRIAMEMNYHGIFGNNENCLVHMDLAARNLMVETGPDDFIKLTGVLDWDSAIFAPKFVSCWPPWYLWQDERFGSQDAMEEEVNAAEGAADDPELLEIKGIFDETMGDEYVRFAYQPEYRLARRLFKLALYGNWSETSLNEISDLIADWESFKSAKFKREAEQRLKEGEKGSPDTVSENEM